MENLKYRLIEEDAIEFQGKTLRRIEALRTFGGVKKGDVGGYIEKESNLSHSGNAWVGENARVCDNARVVYDAFVYGNAVISGNALICNKAHVRDNAWIRNNAQICCQSVVCNRAHVSGNAYKDIRRSAQHSGAQRRLHVDDELLRQSRIDKPHGKRLHRTSCPRRHTVKQTMGNKTIFLWCKHNGE